MAADAALAEDKAITSGCTVTVALFKPASLEKRKIWRHRIGTLYTANAGDGRIVLCQGGKAIRLSYDHKASDKREQQRIQEAGGFVAHDRVAGVLAVSRALGDEELKEFVIGRPFTAKVKLTKESQFLILACDGLWDVCSDQEACHLIQGVVSRDQKAAATILVDYAMQAGSTDNISVMVVYFYQDRL
jgi:protein phosphatase PTC1